MTFEETPKISTPSRIILSSFIPVFVMLYVPTFLTLFLSIHNHHLLSFFILLRTLNISPHSSGIASVDLWPSQVGIKMGRGKWMCEWRENERVNEQFCGKKLSLSTLKKGILSFLSLSLCSIHSWDTWECSCSLPLSGQRIPFSFHGSSHPLTSRSQGENIQPNAESMVCPSPFLQSSLQNFSLPSTHRWSSELFVAFRSSTLSFNYHLQSSFNFFLILCLLQSIIIGALFGISIKEIKLFVCLCQQFPTFQSSTCLFSFSRPFPSALSIKLCPTLNITFHHLSIRSLCVFSVGIFITWKTSFGNQDQDKRKWSGEKSVTLWLLKLSSLGKRWFFSLSTFIWNTI